MITIFTPTYNRAHTLQRLFDSLKAQTSKDFEWIIIDDNSSDNTEKLVNSFIKQTSDFSIVYKKQEHGGKHRAINKAVNIAKFDWFFIVDSDDYLTEDAIEKIHKWISLNKKDSKIAAVSGSRFETNRHEALSVPSILLLNPGLKCYNYERANYNLDYDKAEVYKTSLIKSHPFPEYDGEFFCTEAVCWDNIALDGYYIAFYPDSIYMCEYMDDGLTKNDANGYTGFSKNFYGFLDYVKTEIKCHKISEKTTGLILLSLKIAKEKKISNKILAEKLDIKEKELKDFIKTNEKSFFQKVIGKLYKIFY